MSKNRLNMKDELQIEDSLTTKMYRATLQMDGNFVVFTKEGQVVWETNTAGKGGQRLVMQDDCNLVLYGPSNTPLWSSNTVQCSPKCFLELDENGCLNIINNVWKSHKI